MTKVLVLLSCLFSSSLMAYDLHIENSGKSMDQWISFVKASSDLELRHFIEAKNPQTSEVIRINMENSGVSDDGLWFSPREYDGTLTITVYKPDSKHIALIKKVAEQFGGDVVGDEGESY